MAKWFSTRQFLVRHPWLDSLRLKWLSSICARGLHFLDFSYDLIKFFSPAARQHLLKDQKPAIFALYHQHMVGLLGLQPRQRLSILISQSRDGEIAAQTALSMGFSIVRGSASRGAIQGTRELISAAESGQNLAFLVDGPRGPIYEVKPGVVRLAELTGLPIVPVLCRSRRHWTLKSWDKYMAAAIGAPIAYIYGDPIDIPANLPAAEREKCLTLLHGRMEELRFQAESVWD